MGLLDEVLKAVAPTSASGESHMNLANELLGMLSKGGMPTGLGSLVDVFNRAGLGDVVSSWISTGKNLPVSAEQIQSVLGSEQVRELAAKAGIDPARASEAIAQILP